MQARTLAITLTLTLGSIVALTPVGAADETLDASSVPNSGKYASIDQEGDTIVVAHAVGASDDLRFAVSTDGGETWTNKVPTGTGTSGVTHTRIAVLDDQHWAATTQVSGNLRYMVRTTNGGTSFTVGIIGDGINGATITRNPLDIDGEGNTYVLVDSTYCTSGGTGCTDENNVNGATTGTVMRVFISTDSGVTFTPSAGQPVIVRSGYTTFYGTPAKYATESNRIYAATVDVHSSTSWTLGYTQETTVNGGVLQTEAIQTTNSGTTYTVLPGQVGSAINDPNTPLTNYGLGLHMSKNSNGMFTFLNSAGVPVVAKPDPEESGEFFFEALGATASVGRLTAAADAGGAAAVGFLTSSGTDYFKLATSVDGSSYLVETPVAGSNSGLAAKAPGVAYSCPNILVAYQDPASSLLKVLVDERLGVGCAATIEPAATATVTSLVGFDVDPTGTTAIARTNAGDTVETWDAQGLGTSNTYDTNCSSLEAVTAARENVVFLDCTGDDNLRIKSATLGTVNPPAGCAGMNTDDFDSWNSAEFTEEDAAEVSDLGAYSVNWEVNTGGCTAFAIMVIGTTDGRLGLLTGTFSSAGVFSEKEPVFKQYTASTTPIYNICGQGLGDSYFSQVLVVASSSGSSTVAYRWNGEFPPSGDPTLTSYGTLGGNLGSAGAIDCSSDTNGTMILYSSGATRAYEWVNGAQKWSQPGLDAYTVGGYLQSVAVSLNGLWGAVATETEVHVLDMNNGSILGTIPMPTGTFRSIKMDTSGQNLWIATTDVVERYVITELTTAEPVDTCVFFCDTDPPTSTTSNTGNCQEGSILCVNSSNVPTGFSVGGFNALLGVLLMAGVGGGFYFIDTKSRHSMLFASIGAGVGFFLAYFLGLFPLWLILVGVLVLATVIVLRFRGGL